MQQYDLFGNYIRQFESIKEAVEKSEVMEVGRCASGKLKSSGGYIWKYTK